MRRFGQPIAVAFFVAVGLVLAEYAEQTQPVRFLIRPLIVGLAIAIVVGFAASLLGRAGSVAAAVVVIWLVEPWTPLAIGALIVLAGLIASRLLTGRALDTTRVPVLVATGVFAASGLLAVVPEISTARASGNAPAGSPAFVILLDGYPRADTLDGFGIDISGFVADLEARGFDHYPDATSHHASTWQTLTFMMTGAPAEADDGWGTIEQRRAARHSWRLPDGYRVVVSPIGFVTLDDPPLNPGGITAMEVEIIQESLLAHLLGGWVMDQLRSQLNESLDVVAATDHPRVFAHVIAPHRPFLYAGDEPTPPPGCWPDCNLFDTNLERIGHDVDWWAENTEGYVRWLNHRLIETVDGILSNHPTADIVLVADHGGKLDDEESRRPFLAARTPDRPGLFADSPHPRMVFTLLDGSAPPELAQP